jgi:predicted dehydrogenase
VTDRIRLGLIGCGSIATKRHLPGLSNLKRAGLDTFDVTAVCDAVEANRESATAYVRDTLGTIPTSYNSWEDLVSGGQVDAVDICLPHGLHHVVGVACLDAGLHVAIEKPLAVSLKTGQQLVAAAERSGCVLSAAIPLRRKHGQRTAHWALNQARLIGEPRTALFAFTNLRPPVEAARLTDGMRWRRDRVMGGGSTIIDSGTHFLDTVRYLLGDITHVYAEVRAYRDGERVIERDRLIGHRENTLMAVLTFQSGAVGTWYWSTVAAGDETHECIINGSEGSLKDPDYATSYIVQIFGRGAELRRTDGTHYASAALQEQHRAAIGPDGLQALFPNGVTDEFALTLWDFLRAVQTGQPPEIDGRNGLKTLAVAEALYESSWTGQAVHIDSLLSGETPSFWQRDIDDYWEEQGKRA